MTRTFLPLVWLAIGCASEADSTTPTDRTKTATPNHQTNDSPNTGENANQGKDETRSNSSPPKDYDPLAGKTLAEICMSDSLLLIKWPYDQIQQDYNALCCTDGGLPEDHERCIMDWPSSDVMACDGYDEMRNSIFARYGRSFKTQKWQQSFSKTDWYEIRENYTDEWLSKTAHGNVKQLLKMKQDKTNCME